MNHLNLALLEGTLLSSHIFTPSLGHGGTAECIFTVKSVRMSRDDDESEFAIETNYIDVETHGRLAIHCKDNICDDRGVRVEGRLVCGRGGITRIRAERVEFRDEDDV